MLSNDRDWEFENIVRAIRLTSPERHEGSREVHNVETLPAENILSTKMQQFDTVKEDISEIEAMVAEFRGTETQTLENLDECEVVDALSSWLVQRRKINQEILARGFSGSSSEAGAKPDLAALAKRVRCYNCQGIGHLSRNCTNPRKGNGPRNTVI